MQEIGVNAERAVAPESKSRYEIEIKKIVSDEELAAYYRRRVELFASAARAIRKFVETAGISSFDAIPVEHLAVAACACAAEQARYSALVFQVESRK